MSKKLIAIASAAALALTAFVAVPSMAATGDYGVAITTKIAGTGADATTNAITVNVPTGDVIRASATTTDTTALTITVATTTATGAVTASSTGGIKLLTAAELAAATTTSKSGLQTLSMAAAANSAVFHAFTTSTTGGTIVISNGGNTTTLYVKGVSASGYKMVLSGPSIASKGVAYSFTAVVTDMFGNPTTGLLAANFVSAGLGAFATAPTETVTESTTKGTYTIKLAAADAAATGSGLLSVVLTTLVYAENLVAFGDIGTTATISVNSSDPASSIAALQAQVTAGAVQNAALTADFNALATKYNKLVKKSKRVAKK